MVEKAPVLKSAEAINRAIDIGARIGVRIIETDTISSEIEREVQRDADHIHYEAEADKLVEQKRKEMAREIFKAIEMNGNYDINESYVVPISIYYDTNESYHEPKWYQELKSKYLGEPSNPIEQGRRYGMPPDSVQRLM